MINSRFWMLIAFVVSAAVLLMGWFLGISPKIDEANAAETQRANVETQNAGFQQTLDQLKSDSEKIDSIKSDLKEIQLQLPPDGDLSSFLGQLHELEVMSGVQLTSFSAGEGVPFVSVPNGTDTVTSPLVTSENVIVIGVGLKVSGTKEQVLDFVHDLQFGKRLFLINSFSLQSGSDAEQGYSGSITGFVYVLVDPSAPPPTVTPIAPVTPEPTATPTP